MLVFRHQTDALPREERPPLPSLSHWEVRDPLLGAVIGDRR